LRAVKKNTQAWSLFFEDQHLEQLQNMINILEHFYAGKTALHQLRQASDLYRYPDDLVRRTIMDQIEENRDYKDRFETLLGEIRQSFKRKLAGRPEPEEEDRADQYDL
jgi:hypothetical protein